MIYYGLDDTFYLLSKSVGYISAKEFVEKCKKLDMKEQPYITSGFDSNLPNFDKGYVFHYKTDDNERAILEILEKDNMILQAGIQIIYSPSFFPSKIKKHYKKLMELLVDHYGVGLPMNMGNIEMLNYSDSKTVCYISKSKVNNTDALTLRIGDRRFWG